MTPETERPLLGLRDKIEASYPNPIATAFRRYCTASVDDLTGRQKLLLDLFELLVKFLCAVQLSEGHGYVPNFSQRLSKGKHTLDFLNNNPPLGLWVGLLRELCELDLKGAKPMWSKKISDWYTQAEIDGGDVAVEQLSSRSNLARTTGPPIAIILNSLVKPRNLFAHLPTATEQERKATLFTLESVYGFVLDSASFLGEGELFICKPTINIEDGRYRFSASVLRGTNERDQEFVHAELLQPDWVYLRKRGDHELSEPVVPLTPFLLWQRGNEEKREQMFVLDKVEKNKLMYASFVTGKTHEERNSRLRDVLTDLTSPSFQADFDDNPFIGVPPSVRSNMAKTLYSQGLRLLDYRYFEQAFKFMKDAAAAEKRPEILVSMASVMIELKEPMEEVRETLQQALELDPANTEAQHLIGNLTEYEINGRRDKGSGLGEPLRKTVFHLLCPRKLRNHAITFWFSVIVVWYSASAMTEFISGNPQRAVAMTLAMLCCLAVVLGAAILRPWAERLKTPLQRQLGEMRKERFNEWFDDQLKMIFESFSIHDSKSRKEERNLRILYAIGVMWMISMVGGAIYFSESYKAPFPLMLKRLVDYFVLFAVLYPAVQYTTAITLFVYHVSGLPLRPTLTKLTSDGMRHLGPFVAFNIIFSTLIYSLLHLSFAIGFTNPMRFDLLFLFVGTGIVAIWTIAFPFQLRRSLQASKNSSIVRYSGHVDDAFNKFVEEPSETNEGRYRRLIENERIIQKISVWPLTTAETVFIIGGSNLLLIMVATAYFIHRLGLWTELVGWFR